MASLRDIRLRIRSVKNTQKITGAMKLVAAAKLRRAQESAEAGRPYATALRAMLSTVAGAVESDAHPLLSRRPVKKTELLMITADRGLCGPFNSNVIKTSERYVREHGADTQVQLSIVGTKGRDYFKRRSFDVLEFFGDVHIDKASYAAAAAIGDTLTERFLSGEVDQVKVVSTIFKSPLVQEVEVFPLLPVEPAETAEGESAGGSADFIFEASRAQVLGELLPRYVKTSLYSMILESAASEQGARMAAMDSASTNAAEMIDRLTITYNRARQAAITTELMEIIGGAEALKG